MRKTPLAFLLLLAAGAAFAQQAPEQETPPQQAPEQQAPEQQVSTSDDPDAAESTTSKVPLDEIRRYVWVYNAVKEAYVDPVDDKKLMQAAVRGLLLDLDPHSAYLPKRDAKAFDEVTQGAYTGVGVELMTLPDRTLKVVSPIDDTPAARAGIKAGDIVTAIDGKPVADRDASNDGDDDDEGDGNSAPLRGAPGTKVVLTIQREGRAKPFDVTLTRERIRVTSVKSRTLEPGFGYIRIATFQADTAADFSRAIDTLQAGGPLRGLVIDLRSNPGGLLTAAVQIADELLDKGKIVSTRGRVALSDAEFSATPGDRLNGAPVVVLVDAGSASASEVLAGALRDNGRARVVGSRTFGKGSVQTLLPLDNGDSVKLTTARYYTPSGKSIQALGIQPDLVLRPEKNATNGGRPDYSEATLPRHLRGDGEDMAGSNAGEVLDGDAPIAAALAELKKPIAKAPVATPASEPKKN